MHPRRRGAVLVLVAGLALALVANVVGPGAARAQPIPPAACAAGSPGCHQCSHDSQCEAPLVCASGACRPECGTDRDCAFGLSCLGFDQRPVDGSGAGEWNHCGVAPKATWQPVPGALRQVSAGARGEVWGVNAASQAFRWDAATSAWTFQPGQPLALIAVATAPSATTGAPAIYGVDPAGAVVTWVAPTWKPLAAPAAIRQLAAGDRVLLAVAASGQAYTLGPGGGWTAASSAGAQVCVSARDYQFATDGTTRLSRRALAPEAQAVGAPWKRVPDAPWPVAPIAAQDDGTVWGIAGSNLVRMTHGQWQVIAATPARLRTIAVSPDGVVWATDERDAIYRYR